jgi:hypothetical protein
MSERSTFYAVGLGLLAAVVGLVCLQPEIPATVFQNLSLFRVLLETGQLPEAEPFAFNEGRNPFPANEWGAGGVVYLFLVASRWGEAGWLLLKLICLLAVGTGCYLQVLRNRVQFSVFAIHCCLALCLAFGFSIGQAGGGELLGLVWLTGLLMLIDLLRQNQSRFSVRICLAALLLFGTWSNLHASVLIGLVLWLLAWFDIVCSSWQFKRSVSAAFRDGLPGMLVGCLAILVCLLNPLGRELFQSGASLLANGTTHSFMMDPLWRSAPAMVQWTFIFSVLLAGYACWKSEQWPVLESFGLALLILSGLRTTDLAGLYLVVWLFWVPRLIAATSLGRLLNRHFHRREQLLWRLGVIAAVLFLVVAMQTRLASLPWQHSEHRQGNQLQDEPKGHSRSARYPEGVVAFLRQEGFTGNLFVPSQLGSYLNWELYPQVRISSDSRGASYFPDEVIQEQQNFYQAIPSWRPVLDNPLHQAILIPLNEPIYAPLKLQVERDPRLGWKQIYQDRLFAVFARSDQQLVQRSKK